MCIVVAVAKAAYVVAEVAYVVGDCGCREEDCIGQSSCQ
jgi:hypothetical protein